MKNREENVALEFLRNKYGNNVVPVPDHKDPPDIVVNSTIGVEVRRLNENFSKRDQPEGLEQISIPLRIALEEVLRSFDSIVVGKSYWVGIDFQRPLTTSIEKLKKNIKQEFEQFIYFKDVRFPYEIPISDEILLTIIEKAFDQGTLFSFAGSCDQDSGGIGLRPYIDNIQWSIKEKSQKIYKKIAEYNQWWLILVDCIGWPLNTVDTNHISIEIKDTGNFDRIILIDHQGKKEILSIQRICH